MRVFRLGLRFVPLYFISTVTTIISFKATAPVSAWKKIQSCAETSGEAGENPTTRGDAWRRSLSPAWWSSITICPFWFCRCFLDRLCLIYNHLVWICNPNTRAAGLCSSRHLILFRSQQHYDTTIVYRYYRNSRTITENISIEKVTCTLCLIATSTFQCTEHALVRSAIHIMHDSDGIAKRKVSRPTVRLPNVSVQRPFATRSSRARMLTDRVRKAHALCNEYWQTHRDNM